MNKDFHDIWTKKKRQQNHENLDNRENFENCVQN